MTDKVADSWEEFVLKIQDGVVALAASLGVKIDGELRGVWQMLDGTPGCGFCIDIGSGTPPGWMKT